MLTVDDSLLMIVDVQGNLAQMMPEKAVLFKNLQILIKSAQILGLPIIWLEQMPHKLGGSIEEVRSLLTDMQPISKVNFSCCDEPACLQALLRTGRRQVLIAGIEAHVCVYQSARDLVKLGYLVHVIGDAVASRIAANKPLALTRMQDAGAVISSVEMALFEMQRRAEGEKFWQIVRLLK